MATCSAGIRSRPAQPTSTCSRHVRYSSVVAARRGVLQSVGGHSARRTNDTTWSRRRGSVALAAAAPEEKTVTQPPPPKTVVVTAEDTVSVPTTMEHDYGATLAAYMRLPVENYVNIKLPLGGKLERMGGEMFELVVPVVRFFNLWVQPVLVVRVCSVPDGVEISALDCRIDSSAEKELRLTDAVQFTVDTKFTWNDSPQAINSTSKLRVLVDPPPPFAMLPTLLLQATGNAVMQVSLKKLQREFIANLAKDYDRW
eukprot:CAMPEP_0177774842 /NCGR_PEP_ID=MMETSP0491_2-20121128/13754_1 /TAXON_ID=63592 /ORGANISM="Tetraselmis chuii, Strain PLY429" /LENGTH=255 /DNA_ID=CAMNT_0019293311 /DNA_START=133 /DNA_END=897 /DNA_ORIENTATION=+